MYSETEDLVRDLAENAEGVCRAYLPAGRRQGSYWILGDLTGNKRRPTRRVPDLKATRHQSTCRAAIY